MYDQVEPRNRQPVGHILWGGRYIILVSVVVMVGLAALYTARSEKVYEATAIMEVSIPSQPNTADTTAAAQGLAQNYATLLVSPGFLSKVRPQIAHGRLSTAELESRLSAGALPQTALVELHSTGSSPIAAETLGRETTSAFLADLQSEAASRSASQRAQIAETINGLTTQIGTLQASPNAALPSVTAEINALEASRQALIAQGATLIASGVVQGTSATLSAPPAASSTPIRPRRSLNLLAGLVLGLLLGVSITWLRHLLQPGLRSSEEAATLMGDVPVLASIPLIPGVRSQDPSLSEAFSILRTNLAFAMRGRDLSVVTFVGPNPGVGKTSTIEGLANTAAHWGQNVLVVDGDMRMASLSDRLGHASGPGLSDLLQGSLDLEDLDDALVSLTPGVSLLPTKVAQLDPPSLLSNSRMRALDGMLRERFDIILFDSPPIAGLADGLILASLSDAVVVVVRTDLTSPRDLVATTTSLHQSKTLVAGLVVFEKRVIESYYPVTGEGEPVPPDHAVTH